MTVFGKGQKSRVIPLRGRVVLELEHYTMEPLPFLDRAPEPDDFLLYPEKRGKGGRHSCRVPEAADERSDRSSLVVPAP